MIGKSVFSATVAGGMVSLSPVGALLQASDEVGIHDRCAAHGEHAGDVFVDGGDGLGTRGFARKLTNVPSGVLLN